MRVVFFSVFSSTSDFLSRPVSHLNNSSKILVNLTNFATEKHGSLQLALNLSYKRKSDSFSEKDFLTSWESHTKNFSPIICKRPFDHPKKLLKNSQFHFKGFHFKSISSGSFNNVWWKSRSYTEIKNPSEAYL